MKTFLLALVAAAKFIYYDGNTSIATNVDLDTVLLYKDRYSAPYVWFRDGGREWLIKDPATIKEVLRLYGPVRALDPEYDALRTKLEPLERRENELDRLIDDVEDRIDDIHDKDEDVTAADRSELRRLEARLRELEAQERAIEKEMRVLEAEERKLDRRQEELEKVADRAVEKVLQEAVRKGLGQRP